MLKNPIRSVSFSHKSTTPALDKQRSTSFSALASNTTSHGIANKNSAVVLASEETDINDEVTYVVYEDHIPSRCSNSFKRKDSSKAISFSHRGKILDLDDDDPTLFFELDPHQFIKDLKQLDPHNWDPLPINIMWAWAEVDKKGNGVVSKKDTYRLMKKYNSVVASDVNVMKLIRKCDKNQDNILDVSEIHQLLSLACGKEVSRSDSSWVMSRLEAMAKASTHGGYDSTMTSDPLIVSKAIFEWWWTHQDNRGAFLSRIKAARITAPPTRDAERAARVLQVEVGALDMDSISFEDMVAGRNGDVLSLDLGLAFIKSVGDKVHKACSPFGEALVGCTHKR